MVRGQPLMVPCYAVQVPEGPHAEQAVVLVLFGTEYGFSKEVAERLCSELGRLDDGLYWWALQLWSRQQCDCCALSCCSCADGTMMRAATSASATACCRRKQHTSIKKSPTCPVLAHASLTSTSTCCLPLQESHPVQFACFRPGVGPAILPFWHCYLHHAFVASISHGGEGSSAPDNTALLGSSLRASGTQMYSDVLRNSRVPVPQAQAGGHGGLSRGVRPSRGAVGAGSLLHAGGWGAPCRGEGVLRLAAEPGSPKAARNGLCSVCLGRQVGGLAVPWPGCAINSSR